MAFMAGIALGGLDFGTCVGSRRRQDTLGDSEITRNNTDKSKTDLQGTMPATKQLLHAKPLALR